ncbi:uncharacterized protein MONBRDRAFT_18571 [Monosiga brevicollis MX1]|uniref:Succinate-semialdehyde dehydrogenase, mitochondrial n=1 Tax=Monosiga brevicollis TaxID=81824 RepID=A9UWD3_MONBE|nr:uncharacterized protein MONBRDRAFT_18571 [Monosiga brevicollis MX1]EDQ90543.1 predicted protein [Monosiga brevicollis MX1]|eukprot:XP_001744594.1 hypothetical protein [Monosiga brevicollis MX1]
MLPLETIGPLPSCIHLFCCWVGHQAVTAATKAQRDWARVPVKERAQKLKRWYHLIMDNEDYLARLMTTEQGKPLAEARGEVAYAASFVDWFAEEALRQYGDTHPPGAGNERIYTIHQPVGVCACITPWNFPLAMLTRKAGPALAAGCAMLAKPAAATPLSAQAISALAYEAGIPEALFPVLTCDHEHSSAIGEELTTNPAVRKISFTGSTHVGSILMKQAAGTIKRTSMELGGNAPFIVMDDADIPAAVDGAIKSKFRNSGQTCICANRFFVQDAVHDRFVQLLHDAMREQLKLGNGLEDGVTQGPLIDESAVQKVEELVQDALDKGATLVAGGRRVEPNAWFFEPTLLTDVSSEMKIAQGEIFGPVAAIQRFSTEEEALQRANSTELGLASYLFTKDIDRVYRMSEGLEFGMVGVNTGLISNAGAPFGGVKQAGVGREGGSHGLHEYTEVKYINLKLGQQ